MTLITNAKGSIFQTSGSESWAFSSKGTSREINITQLLLSSCIPLCYLLHHCSLPGKCKRRNVIISQLYSLWHHLILGMISQPEWSLLLPVELDLQNHSWDDVILRLPWSLIFLFFIKSTRSKAKYFSHLSFSQISNWASRGVMWWSTLSHPHSFWTEYFLLTLQLLRSQSIWLPVWAIQSTCRHKSFLHCRGQNDPLLNLSILELLS